MSSLVLQFLLTLTAESALSGESRAAILSVQIREVGSWTANFIDILRLINGVGV